MLEDPLVRAYPKSLCTFQAILDSERHLMVGSVISPSPGFVF